MSIAGIVTQLGTIKDIVRRGLTSGPVIPSGDGIGSTGGAVKFVKPGIMQFKNFNIQSNNKIILLAELGLF